MRNIIFPVIGFMIATGCGSGSVSGSRMERTCPSPKVATTDIGSFTFVRGNVFPPSPGFQDREVGRVLLGDCNGDHLLDAFLPRRMKVYRHREGGGFELTSNFAERRMNIPSTADAGAMVDIDRDGIADLVLLSYKTMVFLGKGDCTFASDPIESPPACNGQAVSASPVDADIDGTLDFSVVCRDTKEQPFVFLRGKPGTSMFEPYVYPPLSDPKTILPNGVLVFGSALRDLNQDGILDSILYADTGMSGVGLGTDPSNPTVVQRDDHLSKVVADINAMAIEVLDIDRDGVFELTLSGILGTVILSPGKKETSSYENQLACLHDRSMYQSWSRKRWDLNGDGWDDEVVFRVFGSTNPETGGERPAPPLVFLNNQGDGFLEVGEAFSLPNLNAYEASCGDIDGDGSLACIVVERDLEEIASILTFHPRHTAPQWVGITLQGTRSNPPGIGAIVTVVGQIPSQKFLYWPGAGTWSHNALGLVIQVPPPMVKDLELEILWPSGVRQRVEVPFSNIGRYVTIVEPPS